LSFGSRDGFGSPDGAIFFCHEEKPVLILIEVKLNESYEQSCNPAASYNSTIRGQLELKWRLMRLFTSNNIEEDRYGVRSIVENSTMIDCYKDRDRKYANVINTATPALDRRRRLRLVEGEGVAVFFNKYASRCDFRDVFYLAITRDAENPLERLSCLRPRCYKENGEEDEDGIQQFCWMNKQILEEP
jgi:hypothetical protein